MWISRVLGSLDGEVYAANLRLWPYTTWCARAAGRIIGHVGIHLTCAMPAGSMMLFVAPVLSLKIVSESCQMFQLPCSAGV